MYFWFFVLFKDLNLIWTDGSVRKGTHSVYKQEDLNSNPPTHVKNKKMVIATDAYNSSIIGVEIGSSLELLAIQPSGNSFQFREALSRGRKGRVTPETPDIFL